MKILLTNDDGYSEVGIKLIYNLLKNEHDVTILAPHSHASGASSSIKVGQMMTLHKHEENIYSLESTPVDTVKLALGVLKINPDLVISGCNNGENMGRCIMYSGTVGASLEANFYNVPSIAVSTYRNSFDIVEKEFLDVFNYICENDLLSREHTLNVNFPNKDKSIGIKKVHVLKEEAVTHIYEKEKMKYITSEIVLKNHEIDNTDYYETEKGYITISKIKSVESTDF